jgi:pimeloyl-ACP methyl ester carboxylesterase
LLGLLFISFVVDYQRFLTQRRNVSHQFLTVDTIYGEVEYLDLGPKGGPVILFSTGGGSGIDSVYAFDWLVNHGFRIIAVNRPGYYKLPVDVVDSIKGHAHIYHAVICKLDIQDVHLFGVSMGGLAALYYAQLYPVKSMVLWSAVTGTYHPNQDATESLLGKLFMTDKGKDFISWMMDRSARLFPKATVRALLKAESNLSKEEMKQVIDSLMDGEEKKRFIQFISSLAPMSQLYTGMMDEVQKSASEQQITWEQLRMPILAIHSSVDEDVGMEHFQRLKDHLPHGEYMEVRAGGHFVWWGAEGKEVIKRTVAFFKRAS